MGLLPHQGSLPCVLGNADSGKSRMGMSWDYWPVSLASLVTQPMPSVGIRDSMRLHQFSFLQSTANADSDQSLMGMSSDLFPHQGSLPCALNQNK